MGDRGCTVKERDVLASVREALGLDPGLDLMRNNVGQATLFDPRTHTPYIVRYGLAVGSSDLVGLVDGRFVGLETKTADGRLTPEQVRWAERIRRKGGFVTCVRSADEAVEAVARSRVREGTRWGFSG
jgi:hypothetical protein